MKTFITRLLLIGICVTLGACASVFDGPPVPYGPVTLNGKTVMVKKLGVDCMCPAIPATDSPFKGAVLPPRAGCNDGAIICVPESIYVYNHEALEVSTGVRHSDTPSRVTGCYEIKSAGGEYKKGDQLCLGAFGDYRIAGRMNDAAPAVAAPDAPVPATPASAASAATAPAAETAAPAAAVRTSTEVPGNLALRLSTDCQCVISTSVARRDVAGKNG